ncbi:hypothetical protein AB0395_21615 [Streptosporangium sp. NPDC051023]|uniref:hypothetical protein n=1 Tax=Streptosporangium sp. NPDC051023 TaxID=3155410 RepID=UPI0034500137
MNTREIQEHFREVTDEENLNAHPATREALEAIEDPWEQFLKACEIANENGPKSPAMAALQEQRVLGIAVLHLIFRVSKLAIGRILAIPELASKGRSTDRRVVQNCIDLIDEGLSGQLPDWTKEEAAMQARQAHLQIVERTRIGTVAREFRKAHIFGWTEGWWGQVESNAKLSRESGLSTAAVAQIRTGKVNPTAAERREREERKQREQREQTTGKAVEAKAS